MLNVNQDNRSRGSPDARRVLPTGWDRAALRGLEFVAYPALAGAAFCLLCLGVVSWLPALAAVAHALDRWRVEGETRCFVAVFAAFPRMWRRLWRHAVMSTVAITLLAVNLLFLAGRAEPVAFALLAVQVGILAALVPYHLCLAAVAGSRPDSPALYRDAALLAFGVPRRGFTLLAAGVLAPVLTLPLAVGPFLLGPTLPVLLALNLLKRSNLDRPGSDRSHSGRSDLDRSGRAGPDPGKG